MSKLTPEEIKKFERIATYAIKESIDQKLTKEEQGVLMDDFTSAFVAGEQAMIAMFIRMLKNRICFDQTGGRGCDHQVCYGNLNLIADLEAGKTE